MSVSISSKLIKQRICLRNSNPGGLVKRFVDALDRLATQSKAHKILKFLEIDTIVKSKLNQIFSALKHCRCLKEPVLEFEFEEECIEE